ncbi:hypothetical protein EVAR_27328_1 [Eumeta japonica]|uniref:Uncharacterized protein n=1 Tax=Eumeta variegata TaxID=151549 RepID=A0A4C1UDV0_EUMVA|nr:hypothetical protein EVAR_27328_1 [Eumeta japonica]
MVVLGSFSSSLQEWMSDTCMRRCWLVSAQHSNPEAALARSIFAKKHLPALPTAEEVHVLSPGYGVFTMAFQTENYQLKLRTIRKAHTLQPIAALNLH